MVGGEHLLSESVCVSIGAWIVSAVFTAVMAEVLLLGIGSLTVLGQVETGAVGARNCISDHADNIQQTFYIKSLLKGKWAKSKNCTTLSQSRDFSKHFYGVDKLFFDLFFHINFLHQSS